MIFSDKGVLGINARNLLYIKPYNASKAILFADNKLQTKRFLETRKIPVPRLIGTISSFQELKQYPFHQLPTQFVVKPNTGYGGEGIIVFSEHIKKSHVLTTNGQVYTYTQLEEHITDILDGQFSINDKQDIAFFEERLQTHSALQPYAYKGLPDIRIIVFNLMPVMAMLRLPTKESNGKANLHLGALGCGVDIGKGEITYTSYKNKLIDRTLEGNDLKGIRIPYWDDILLIASKIQYSTNVGYLAVDIALDDKRGPVLLEINARAGLNIQVANQAALRKRLEQVKGIKIGSPEKGVRLAQELFGKTMQKNIEHLSGKTIIGEEEVVEIPTEHQPIITKAKISTMSPKSYMDEVLFEKLVKKTKNTFLEKRFFPCKLFMEGKKINVLIRSRKFKDETYQLVLGKDALSHFMIDPYKYDPQELDAIIAEKKQKSQEVPSLEFDARLYQTDTILSDIETELSFISLMKPTNIDTEKQKFIEKKGKYNPIFQYKVLPFDENELSSRIRNCYTDDSMFGKILEQKKQEYLLQLQILQERSHNKQITVLSQRLYGIVMEPLIALATSMFHQKIPLQKESDRIYSAEDIRQKFETHLQQSNITQWKVRLTPSLASRIAVGKQKTIKIRDSVRHTSQELEASIRHEIETHIFRTENGKQQPYKIFRYGTSQYLETEEGLAIYLVTHTDPTYPKSLYTASLHVLALSYGVRHNFQETAAYLQQIMDVPLSDIFDKVLRQKRGLGNTAISGAFYKDAVYLQGYEKVREFIQSGGNIADLFYGKMALQDIDTLLSFPNLKKPKYLPRYVQSASSLDLL